MDLTLPPSRELATDPLSTAILQRARNALTPTGGGAHEISDRCAPGPVERVALNARAALLRRWLAPCTLNEAATEVARLFGIIPEMRDNADTLKQVADYGRALSPMPLWAICAACRQVLESGTRYRPGAPELLAKARESARGVRTELDEIETLLKARIYHAPDEGERAQVGEMFRQLSRSLGGIEEPSAAAAPRSPEAFAHWSANAPMQASEALLALERRQRFATACAGSQSPQGAA